MVVDPDVAVIEPPYEALLKAVLELGHAPEGEGFPLLRDATEAMNEFLTALRPSEDHNKLATLYSIPRSIMFPY